MFAASYTAAPSTIVRHQPPPSAGTHHAATPPPSVHPDVIPAKAGIQYSAAPAGKSGGVRVPRSSRGLSAYVYWIPAFAGMTWEDGNDGRDGDDVGKMGMTAETGMMSGKRCRVGAPVEPPRMSGQA
jgi:hypothetical protein